MLSKPLSIVQEIHKLNTSSATVLLAALPDYNIYLARSLSDIVWNGTYKAAWFEIEAMEEDSSSNAPQLSIVFSNLGGMVEDEVLVNNGFPEATVEIYLVNVNCLDQTDPVYSVIMQVQKVTCTRETVTFKLGMSNPLLMAFPGWKFHDSICQYAEFKGELCGYTGVLTTCNRTLTQCIARSNTERFGAQLGIMGAIQTDDGL